MLQTLNLYKYFNKGTVNEVLALDDCSLSIAAGEFVIIIGSNGSGKTTLLNLIAGSYFPDKGQILLAGKKINSQRDFQRSKYIARVFQDPMAGTAPELTIIDNFRLAALRTKNKTFKTGVNAGFKSKVRERLAILNLGLENKLDIMVGKLSGGQRQALTLLMAVMDDSKILLLDEPTAALDPKSSEKVIEIADRVIKELSLTAVLVTHNMQYAVNYGNRLLMMRRGKIVQDLTGAEKKALSAANLYEWFDKAALTS